jgi:hypothetical protein
MKIKIIKIDGYFNYMVAVNVGMIYFLNYINSNEFTCNMLPGYS